MLHISACIFLSLFPVYFCGCVFLGLSVKLSRATNDRVQYA
jgi:hypothetical protein